MSEAALLREGVSFCPDWAFDPFDRDTHPRTGGKWQPIWNPDPTRSPRDDNERFLDEILEILGISRVYEPLLLPIKVPYDPTRKHKRTRRWLRNDFFLNEYVVILEVFSGYSQHGLAEKHRRLGRMRKMYHIPFLVITVDMLFQLEEDPTLLRTWIREICAESPLAA